MNMSGTWTPELIIQAIGAAGLCLTSISSILAVIVGLGNRKASALHAAEIQVSLNGRLQQLIDATQSKADADIAAIRAEVLDPANVRAAAALVKSDARDVMEQGKKP
jgi:hypothetical protein